MLAQRRQAVWNYQIHLSWNQEGTELVGLMCRVFPRTLNQPLTVFADICAHQREVVAVRNELIAQKIPVEDCSLAR